MDALMAALVAAALAQVGDRPAWLAAILPIATARPASSSRWRPSLGRCRGLAGAAGGLLAPQLTPEAKQLFLALALVLQGGGALFLAKAPDRLERWRLGAAATSLLGCSFSPSATACSSSS